MHAGMAAATTQHLVGGKRLDAAPLLRVWGVSNEESRKKNVVWGARTKGWEWPVDANEHFEGVKGRFLTPEGTLRDGAPWSAPYEFVMASFVQRLAYYDAKRWRPAGEPGHEKWETDRATFEKKWEIQPGVRHIVHAALHSDGGVFGPGTFWRVNQAGKATPNWAWVVSLEGEKKQECECKCDPRFHEVFVHFSLPEGFFAVWDDGYTPKDRIPAQWEYGRRVVTCEIDPRANNASSRTTGSDGDDLARYVSVALPMPPDTDSRPDKFNLVAVWGGDTYELTINFSEPGPTEPTDAKTVSVREVVKEWIVGIPEATFDAVYASYDLPAPFPLSLTRTFALMTWRAAGVMVRMVERVTSPPQIKSDVPTTIAPGLIRPESDDVLTAVCALMQRAFDAAERMGAQMSVKDKFAEFKRSQQSGGAAGGGPSVATTLSSGTSGYTKVVEALICAVDPVAFERGAGSFFAAYEKREVDAVVPPELRERVKGILYGALLSPPRSEASAVDEAAHAFVTNACRVVLNEDLEARLAAFASPRLAGLGPPVGSGAQVKFLGLARKMFTATTPDEFPTLHPFAAPVTNEQQIVSACACAMIFAVPTVALLGRIPISMADTWEKSIQNVFTALNAAVGPPSPVPPIPTDIFFGSRPGATVFPLAARTDTWVPHILPKEPPRLRVDVRDMPRMGVWFLVMFAARGMALPSIPPNNNTPEKLDAWLADFAMGVFHTAGASRVQNGGNDAETFLVLFITAE